MADKKPPVILVDGSSYVYRAFHALPQLTTATGQPTGAIKGVINMLRRLRKDYPASEIAVIFDASGKTFRNELYAEYKAHRPPMPDELRTQIEPIHRIIQAMGIPLLSVVGVEADDVIGTLAREATEMQCDVIISTGDKDIAQLVNQHITLVNTMTDTTLDVEGVRQKFGVPPERIIDLLALMGDKSDNIPGVPGVGEKTALGLVQFLGGVDDILQNLSRVHETPVRGAKALQQKLEQHTEQLLLSRELATIKTDVVLPFGMDALAPQPVKTEELKALFTELEFRAWADAVVAPESAKPEQKKKAIQHDLVLDLATFDHWIDALAAADVFSFDTETDSLDYMLARVVGVSFSITAGSAAYVPFGHDYPGAPEQLSREYVLAKLRPLLEAETPGKIGQNLKYDKHVLANEGITLRGIFFDTMLESYVLDSVGTRHNMDALAEKYLERKTISFEEVAGKGAKQISFNQVLVDAAAEYAAEDAEVVLCLHHMLWPMLNAEAGLRSVLCDIEMPLLSVLCNIERTGTLIDAQLLQRQSHELGTRMLELEKQVYEAAGQTFNLDSPKQLQEILYGKLQLPVLKKTPTGQPSTAEPVLQDLALDYELPKILMEYRSLSKLKSTYTDKLPLMINATTGRVHTSYHQAVTATGRLSSVEPNLQNIPVRTAEGRRIRQAFIAPHDSCILAADYSQIELRIMAHLSGDAALLKAFSEGHDIHRATAAEIFDTAFEEVSNEQRRSAKAVNFGLIYGMSAFGLAKQLRVGRYEAQDYIDRYFQRYPGVRDYMDRTRAQAAEKGYVETIFGRRLYLPDIHARSHAVRQAAERTAINAPMQGSAADIIKRAMLAVDVWLRESGIDARMIMQVHDELVLEVAVSQQATVKDEVVRLMSGAANLLVPLVVDTGVGANWDEAH